MEQTCVMITHRMYGAAVSNFAVSQVDRCVVVSAVIGGKLETRYRCYEAWIFLYCYTCHVVVKKFQFHRGV
jgi:hypothetical protein